MPVRNITGTIQIRHDSSTNWSTENPILEEGEFGYDLTNNILKIGDGLKTWSELQALNGGGTVDKNLVLNPILLISEKTESLSSATNTVNGASYSKLGTVSGTALDVTNDIDWDKVVGENAPNSIIIGLQGAYLYNNVPDYTTVAEHIFVLDLSYTKVSSTEWALKTVPRDIENIFRWKSGANNYERTGNMAFDLTITLDITNHTAKLVMKDYYNASNISSSQSNHLRATLYKIAY